jgi:SAM-dependent methyltransferase
MIYLKEEDYIMAKKEDVREFIRSKYSDIALKGTESSGCSCSSSCCGDSTDVQQMSLLVGYSAAELAEVPAEANMGLGCGNPLAIAGLKAGETVLDLGSGGGFDCFLARRQVGETGYVIGVDMTPEMIKLARKNLEKSGYSNVEFRLGEIEHLPVADASVDVIISNCVINLSLEKEQVFKEAYRVLKPKGRLSISDVVATAKLPREIKDSLTMMAGCIAGAEFIEDLEAMLQKAGFSDIQITPKDNSREIIGSWAPGGKVEDYVASVIMEARKA